jgi:membrane protein YdbS with pleckstrin-like domain
MSDGPESSSQHHGLHHTATHALPHEQKLARQRRHIQILTVVCVLVLAALVYAAAFDLNSVAEWIVFAMIIVTVIGAMIAVHGSDRDPG